MKIALISDIHGNHNALKRVLSAIDCLGVSLVLCAGDLVSYGGGDNEVISLLHERMVPCVAGNYDYAVAWDLPTASNKPSSIQTEPLKQAALDWSKRNTSNNSKQFLRALPWRQQFHFGDKTLVMMHAGPGSLFDWYTPENEETLNQLADSVQSDFIILGHTHKPFLYKTHSTTIVNPGAVGRSLDGDVRAVFAVLDMETEEADFHRVEYDINETVQMIRASGMPDGVATLVEQGVRRIEEAVSV